VQGMCLGFDSSVSCRRVFLGVTASLDQRAQF
jgi:hypothetical protein